MARAPSFAPTGVREAETMYTGLACGRQCQCGPAAAKRARTIMRACLMFCDKRRREVCMFCLFTEKARRGGRVARTRGRIKGPRTGNWGILCIAVMERRL